MESNDKNGLLLVVVVFLCVSWTAIAGLVTDSQVGAGGMSVFSISLTENPDASDVMEEFIKNATSSCRANCSDILYVEITFDSLSQFSADFHSVGQFTETIQAQYPVLSFSYRISAGQ